MITLSMADIHLKDIGKGEEGTTMSAALKEVFTVLNKNIAGAVTAELGSGRTVEKAVDELKGFFGK